MSEDANELPSGVQVKLARADASYILDWLRQTGAPANIVLLQRRVVTRLGGYMAPEERGV